MKIALVSDTFLPQINGVVTATIMLAKSLTRKGHEVHILAPEYKEYTGDSKFPFPIKRFTAFPAWFYEDFKWAVSPNPAVHAYIHKHNFDIIHFQTPMALGFQSISIARILKKPIVGTFHTFLQIRTILNTSSWTTSSLSALAGFIRINTITDVMW